MNVNELIERLRSLPEKVRERPLMADPELTDEENLADLEEFDRPAHVEERVLAFTD